MRTKRSKQYKKLVQQFQLHHGFREPYQVLVDADIVRDSQRFAMDLQAGLERTLHGKVKIMITQCCIRHLYAEAAGGGETAAAASRAISLAKTFERRRCGHRPEEFPEPLPALECLNAVVDDKKRGENRHRYVVASQDHAVRRLMRGLPGVPLIYINRSVMIMEPMSETTAQVGAQAERAKFRSELRRATGEKRKREPETEAEDEADAGDDSAGGNEGDKQAGKTHDAPEKQDPKKPKTKYGVKGPNPLSVKKKKKPQQAAAAGAQPADERSKASDDAAPKKRRKRKHKPKTGDTAGGSGDGDNDSGVGGATIVAGDAVDA